MSVKEIYKTHNKELLIIIKIFKYWHYYLQKTAYTGKILYNHNNLRYFMIITALNEHQSWWILKLSKFNFNIKYRSGQSNSADLLLRRSDYRISEMK